MRILAVEPGPHFSVADVHRGWVAALRELGCEVVDLNLGPRLDFYSQAALRKGDDWVRAFEPNDAIAMAAKGIEAAAYECWPDIVLITSCFFVPAFTLDLLRSRGHKVVILHTESPYEDEGQLLRAPHADLNLLNDPTGLDKFRAVNPNSHYTPHSYDPAVHHLRPPKADLASDFCFVGTGFPSRVEFFEKVDWSGIDVALAGSWNRLPDTSPLRPFVCHLLEHCVDNDDAHDLYASTKASANLYRVESETPEQAHGWSMGPREVELAASGTFFLTEARGENRAVLPMVPTFDGPEDFGEKLRWWLAHDDERSAVADAAREAIADRTFTSAAKRMLTMLERLAVSSPV